MKIDLSVNWFAYISAMRAGMDMIGAKAALSALEWWREAGVDLFVEEEAHDWLKRRPPVSAPVQPAPAPIADALPDTLDAFTTWLMESGDVPEARWGSRRIGPAGDPASGLMLISDLPDADDLAEGRLFGGATGRLFERMLAAIGRTRESLYLSALATVRPVGGRIDEAGLARLTAIMRHHLMLARPRRILLLGDAASRALLGTGFLAARDRIHIVNHHGIKVEAVATFHPRQLVRQPALKAEAWRDLLLLTRELDL